MNQLLFLSVILGLGTLGLLVFLYRQFRHHPMLFFMFSGFITIVLGFGYVINPDIWRWYQHEQQQVALNQAKSILAEPKKMAMLKIRLQDVVNVHPEDAKAWFLLGRLWAAENDWNQATKALQHAYQIQPKDIKTAIFYAESLIRSQQKMSVESRQVLLKVLKQDPEQADALLMMAEDAVSRQCPLESIEYWKRVLVMVPKNSEMYQTIEEAIEKAHHKDATHCIKVKD